MIKKILALCILTAVVLLVFSGCQEEEMMQPGEERMVRPEGTYSLYWSPSPLNISPSLSEISGGTVVEIVEIEGRWIFVRKDDIEGWIPSWYISDKDSPLVRDLDHNYLTANRNSYGFLYPHGPKIIEISKGRLLEPVKEWGNWYKVSIITYDNTDVDSAWMTKTYLSPVEVIEPVEGILEAGSEIYYVEESFEEIYDIEPTKVVNELGVHIKEERDNYLHVRGMGDKSFWTEKDNIRFTK